MDNHDSEENAVTLMTLHSAKGLEFPYVFMPGMEDGLFPGWRAFDREDGLEEERRLCYVGITRAKKRLWMTSARTRTLYGRTDYTRESVFLHELDEKLIEGDSIYEKKDRRMEGLFRDGASERVPIKPFDQLKYAQAQTKKKAAAMAKAASADFSVGDRVAHSKFGEGTVLEVDGKVIRIEFKDGVKKLALGIAPLEKL